MDQHIQDEGIIIAVYDTGEADKSLMVMTASHGLIRLTAKGVRHLRSRRGGHIDVPFKIRFQTGRSSSPRMLADIITLESYDSIHTDLSKTKRMYTFLEILASLVPQEQIDKPLYDSLSNYLACLVSISPGAPEAQDVDLRFGQYLLRHAGYPPPPAVDADTMFVYFQHLISRKLTSLDIK
jgi:DNA repair protein RecO